MITFKNIYYISLITILLFAKCSNNGEKTIFDVTTTEEYKFTDSLVNAKNDSVFKHIKDLRSLSSRYANADALADYYSAWAYCSNLRADSIRKYVTLAYNKLITTSDTSQQESKLRIAEMELIIAYLQLEFDKNPDSAKVLIQHSYGIFKSLNKKVRQIECNIYMAEVCRQKDNYAESFSFLREMEYIYQNVNPQELTNVKRFETLSNMTQMSIQLGYLYLANKYLQMASELYDYAEDNNKKYYLYQKSIAQLYQYEYLQAEYTAQRLLSLSEKSDDKEYITKAYTIRGLAYSRINIIDKAIEFYNNADSIAKANNIKHVSDMSLLAGEIAVANKKYKEAYEILFDSAQYVQYNYNMNMLLESQKKYYISQNDYRNTYYIERREHITSLLSNEYFIDNSEQRIKDYSEQYLYSKSDNEKVTADMQQLVDNHEKERCFFMISILILIILIIIYKRRERKLNNEKVQKEYSRLKEEINQKVKMLEHQKEMLQITNNRIAESISYAERIQHSIIPHPHELDSFPITGSFIFYSPLDVVSGDFYWFTRKNDYLIICCADCTGHGIPGAFMSMIASTILNDICNKSKDDVSPATILEQLDSKLIENLAHNKSENGMSKDGLDISIVSINTKTKKVVSSSAKRPIIIIKDQEIINIRGTRRSIGDTEEIIRTRPFVDTETQLHEGDVVYMFTDGYSDQFGGNNGAKMKNNKIKKFLRAIHDDSMDEQSLTVQELFTQWKGDYPQTDDVLFIGIKL